MGVTADKCDVEAGVSNPPCEKRLALSDTYLLCFANHALAVFASLIILQDGPRAWALPGGQDDSTPAGYGDVGGGGNGAHGRCPKGPESAGDVLRDETSADL